jgi:predicted nicotinamide N-methyase
MAASSQARLRAFVRAHTRLELVPDLPEVRLHVGSDAMAVLGAAAAELGDADAPLPFWAFPWAGGLAVARYLVDHPDEVEGKDIVDLGSGSGLVAIVAMRIGARSALAIDVDRLSEAAVAVNARANGVVVGFRRHDILDDRAPAVDVILAGDVCYEETMARRAMAWLRGAAAGGTRVLVGDPGRTYLPPDLTRLASYRVRTTREIEDAEVKASAVYTFG